MKLLTPVLSFTMQVYENMPLKHKKANIQLESFPEVTHIYEEDVLKLYASFNHLRDDVLAALEMKRSEGFIGSAQEAEIVINPSDKTLKTALLTLDSEELARLFVVSSVVISDDAQTVSVRMAKGEKM